MRIGIYEKSLPKFDNWQQTFSAACDAGFNFIDIPIDPTPDLLERLDWTSSKKAQLRNASIAIGIPIFSIVLSAHRKYSFGSRSEQTRQAAYEILKKAIDFAVDVGIRSIQIAGYFTFDEPTWPGAKDYFLEGLIKSERLAAQSGVILGLENMNGTDILSIATAMEFVNSLHSPWFQLYPDIGNLNANELDVDAELTKGAGHIIGIHVKDTRKDIYRRVPFGTGTVNFASAFHTLAEINYTGSFLLEMWNDQVDDVMQTIIDSRNFVLQKMEEGHLIEQRSEI